MEETLSPLDQATNAGGRLDTIADLVGRLQKLGGAEESTIPGLLDEAVNAMKAAASQLEGEAAFGRLAANFYEGDAAALVAAAAADAAGGAAIGTALVRALEAAAPFLTLRSSTGLAAAGGIDIVRDAGGSGTVTVTGASSLLSSTGTFIAGDQGVGALAVKSGGTVIVSSGTGAGVAGLLIANTRGADGSAVTVSGSGSRISVNGELVVGEAASGSIQINNGATVTATCLDAATVSAARAGWFLGQVPSPL
jgi:T5SS/PEP-CTERM-associated repeat protein